MRLLAATSLFLIIGCASSPSDEGRDEPPLTVIQEAPVEAGARPPSTTERGPCLCDYVWSRDPATADEPGFLCHPRGDCPAGVVCVPGEMTEEDVEPVCVPSNL
jgi:hypothetical protein